MKSCLYRCVVMHKRDRPKPHRFAYPCFVFCIDLDELDRLDQALTFFSYNQGNLYSLLDSDHFSEGASGLKANVQRFLRNSGVTDQIGRVELVTNLRAWGHVFNPVSFFFVYRPDGDLLCCLSEVANTFHEQKLYLVKPEDSRPDRLRQSHRKLFYISPFSELDTHLHFDLRAPADRIKLVISESDADGIFFFSSLQGQRQPLTNASLLRATLRFPFITLKVVGAIHWQALKLYLKKVPFFRKAHRPELQTETRPYLDKRKRSA